MPRERLHRDHLRTNVQVFDGASERRLGSLMDISMGGLGIAGSGEPPADGDATLLLRFPLRVRDRRELTLAVSRRWLEYTEGRHWHAGFRLLEIPDADIPVLESLMTWYSDSGDE